MGSQHRAQVNNLKIVNFKQTRKATPPPLLPPGPLKSNGQKFAQHR